MTTETNEDLIEKAINKLETCTLLYFNTGNDRIFDKVNEAKETIKGIVDCQQEEIGRLREAIGKSLEKHKWNNEESARVLEQALAGVTNGSEA